MDFVFVDADHSYRFVKADTERAFQLIRPGGVILWDDYVWNENHPECEGVARCLHELLSQKELKRIAGTRFAVYKDHESTRS
jgi:predicted O-methyltransferase YrrM